MMTGVNGQKHSSKSTNNLAPLVMIVVVTEKHFDNVLTKQTCKACFIDSHEMITHIRILHECQVWIDKSVPRVTFWHHEACRVMPNCDPRDRFVYPYLTQMMDSFSCTP